jgi:alpha-tubulin suppressor-like RCC1 family protein
MKSRQASAFLAVAALLSGCGGSSDQPAATAAAVTSARSSAQAAALAPSQVSRLPGKMADYSVVRSAGTVTVTDLTGHHPTSALAGVTRLLFADVVLALDSNTAPAKVFRLYQAAFDRAPDLAGLGFHIAAVEAMGANLEAVAAGFIASDEFNTKYGALDNANFVNQLYLNVLHRAADAAGKKYWTDILDAKSLTRAGVLNQFAESAENVANVAPSIAAGVAYIPYISGGAATAVAIGGSEATAGWNADTLINVSLRAHGVIDVVGKNLKCEALDPTRLTVAANCVTAKGYRLGEQQMRISADGLSAILTVRIIPQRQALGTQGNARHHNIVTTAAGGALAWGYNGGNVLGQGGAIPGSSNWSNLPLPVKELTGVVATSIGDTDAMALTAGGNVLAWAGSQSFARTTLSSKLPSLVRNSANDGSLDKIVQVEVGMSNAVALADDGQVWTWGQYPGQGAGTGAYPGHPLQASGEPLANIVQVAAGGLFSLALAEDGKVYAWGWNGHGQTGRGTVNTKEDYAAPVRLASDNSELTGVIAISAGYHHSLALTADGRVYAWGDNAYSEIGQGVRAGDYPRAVLVKGPGAGTGLLGNIAMVAAGGNHSYALDKLGNVWSWGLNNTGELGDGLNSNLPVTTWLQRVEAAAHPQPKLTAEVADPKADAI